MARLLLTFKSRRCGPGVLSKEGGKIHYPVRLWVEGPDTILDQIELVRYQLHPSFYQPTRFGVCRADNFAVRIKTWGYFQVMITVLTKDGHEHTRTARVTFEVPLWRAKRAP